MKIVLLSLIGLTVAAFTFNQIRNDSASCIKPASIASPQIKAMTTNDSATGVAVVELFTSEGCSSCPSADALLAKLDGEKRKNVYVLSFHVDYWDRLGWKDSYSNPQWTARQRAYVDHLHLESAYTPQAVVNGQEEFVGSDKLRLYTSVDNALHNSAATALQLTSVLQGNKLSVSYATSQKSNANINIALVQTEATSQVKSGENSGRSLHHINVVRDFAQTNATITGGQVAFNLPKDFTASTYKVIGYLQQKGNDKIVAASEARIQ